jgi:hypothetical protein
VQNSDRAASKARSRDLASIPAPKGQRPGCPLAGSTLRGNYCLRAGTVRIVSRARKAASHSLFNDRDLIRAVGLAQMLESSVHYACIPLTGHEQQVWIVE